MPADTHEVTLLAVDLDKHAATILDKVARVTRDAADSILADAQRRVRGHQHLPHLPRSFTADVEVRPGQVDAEIGAEWERLQGRLDVYIEYGTPTSRGIAHWLPAWERESPIWVARLEDAAEVFG